MVFSRDRLRDRSPVRRRSMSPLPKQDREEFPPFYLEVYYRLDGRHNRQYQFEPREKKLLCNKLELYFWRDSNLTEIAEKISETIPFEEAKIPGTKYRKSGNRHFAFLVCSISHRFLNFL